MKKQPNAKNKFSSTVAVGRRMSLFEHSVEIKTKAEIRQQLKYVPTKISAVEA